MNIEQRITNLENLFVNHRHNLIDGTKSLPGATAYAGYLNNGTAVLLPTGWTSGKNGTGDYTVTHNLGTTNYAVAVTAVANADYLCMLKSSPSTNSFTIVVTRADGGANVDVDLNFILAKN